MTEHVTVTPEDASGSPAAAAPLLAVDDLRVHFRTDAGEVHAVNGVSFTVAPGETLALVGESGSGKSVTGMSLLGLLEKPAAQSSGSVLWKGNQLIGASESYLRKVRGAEISMIFQDAMTALNPVMTVGKQITEMLRMHTKLRGKAARERAIESLAAVGIPNPRQRFRAYPHELSGGLRQRAMIAMAISCDPQLIIADEPTTALDVTVQAQVLEVMAEMQERTGAGLILITHDLGVVAGVADRVMVMYAGRQIETGSVDDVFYDTRHPYTLGLLASLPRVDVDAVVEDEAGETRLKPIVGQPPSLLALPSGCSFHPRCELRDVPGACDRDRPETVEVAPGHAAACHFSDDLLARTVAVGSTLAAVAAEGPTPHAEAHVDLGTPPETGGVQ